MNIVNVNVKSCQNGYIVTVIKSAMCRYTKIFTEKKDMLEYIKTEIGE